MEIKVTPAVEARRPRLLPFLLCGCLLGLTVEAQFKLLAFFQPAALGAAVLLYPLIVLGFFGLGRFVDRLVAERQSADLLLFALTGVIGLLIEWTLLGNSPGANPRASQVGMFCLWTGFGFLPRILARSRAAEALLRQRIWLVFGLYALAGTTAGLLLPSPQARIVGVVGAALLAYGLLNLLTLAALLRGDPRAASYSGRLT